jgi:retron-type reverse transcriptase
MKRYGNLFHSIVCYDNLLLAFENASRGRSRRRDVVRFKSNLESNLLGLQQELMDGSYRTSEYTTFIVYEPKERVIYRLPFRDRVVHWAIMLVVEKIWISVFTRDTYSCIKGRGIHPLLKKLRRDMASDAEGTAYCLKIDVKKFYPSIDHCILKKVIRIKIKDSRLLSLLDEIIYSADAGVPIGNYLSQFFANLYLAELDHRLKELHHVKYYYRYADDIVILASNKMDLHAHLSLIKDYLSSERRLAVKENWQVFPVSSRGVDFVGYVTYHTHCLARKANKQRLCRQVAALRKRGLSNKEIRLKAASRLGFMGHCNSINLLKKIDMKNFSEVKNTQGNMTGDKYNIEVIIGREIHLKNFEITESKYKGKCLTIQYDIFEQVKDGSGNLLVDADGNPAMEWVEHITFTGSEALMKQLDGVELDEPCAAKIIKQPIGDKGKHFYKIVDP